jgi:hypothetical protein
LLAGLLIVTVSWFLWHPLGVAMAIMATGNFRRFVVRNAAFWNATAILTVGVLWGVAMALAITFLSNAVTTSSVIKIFLLVEGFFAVGYIGYAPAPEDLFMFNKAGQTANVGMICYVVTGIIVAVISR